MYDVTIIGAGLAGLQLARLLARQDIRVLLVDRRRSVTDSIRTTGIFVRRTFEEFDSLHHFLGPAIRRAALHSPAGQTVEIESDRDEFRVGRMAPLHEAMLRDAVLAGATWAPSTSYEKSTVCDDTITVSLRQSSRRFDVRTRFIVGADGARSRVARDLRLDENTRWIVGVEDVFPSCSRGEPRFDCWVDPVIAPGYLAWIVDDGEEAHVGVGGHPARFDPAAALRSFADRMRTEGRLPVGDRRERRSGLIPVNGVLRTIATDRGLLVGDAAGAVSPLTAGGLDACMRLSRTAADVLARSVRSGLPIAGYDGNAFRSRFASRLLSRWAFDVATRSRFAIELGFAAARNPLGLALVKHVFFGRGSFPDIETVPEATSA